MTPESIAARTARAVDAAATIARRLGLDVSAPVVLHDVFSVVVHLAPSPVVARVPVVTPPWITLAQRVVRQQRELDAVAWLHAAGLPVVAPSPLVPRAPAQHDGLSVTFWELAEVTADHAPYNDAGVEATATLHAALRGMPTGGLGLLSPAQLDLPTLLAALREAPGPLTEADLAHLAGDWAALAPHLASPDALRAALPGVSLQAIHGDAPQYNVIQTTTGPRFADFEDVCLGPIEWDLAGLPPDALAAYDDAARARGLRPHDPEALRRMGAARSLQVIAAFALAPQLPVLAEGLLPALAAWRDTAPL
ncbi:MAG: hypothetical protein RIT28_4788 [Pseudomonadota bacterium]